MESEDDQVEQFMSSDLVTADPGMDIKRAADVLLEKNVGSLLVLDSESELAGVLTSTDLVGIVSAGEHLSEMTVADYMTEDVVTVGPQDSIRNAAAKMIMESVQHLPVTDAEDGVVGMLSSTDMTTKMTYMDSSGTE